MATKCGLCCVNEATLTLPHGTRWCAPCARATYGPEAEPYNRMVPYGPGEKPPMIVTPDPLDDIREQLARAVELVAKLAERVAALEGERTPLKLKPRSEGMSRLAAQEMDGAHATIDPDA